MSFEEAFRLKWIKCIKEKTQSFELSNIKYQRHWRGKFLSDKQFVCIFPPVLGVVHLVAKGGKMLDCPKYYYDELTLSKLVIYPLDQSAFNNVIDLKDSLLNRLFPVNKGRLTIRKNAPHNAQRADERKGPIIRLNAQLEEANFLKNLRQSMQFQENSEKIAAEVLHGVANNIEVNKRRRKNFALATGEVLELDVNSDTGRWALSLPGQELIFSTIPYDMSKRYIAFLSALDVYEPAAVENFLNANINVYDVYLRRGLRRTKEQIAIQHEFLAQDRRFRVCVAGRILQHLDTGSLTASLSRKMLHKFVAVSGTTDFVAELQSFIGTVNIDPRIVLASTLGLTFDEYLTSPLTQTMKGYLS